MAVKKLHTIQACSGSPPVPKSDEEKQVTFAQEAKKIPKINKTRAMLAARAVDDRLPKRIKPEVWQELNFSKKCAHTIGLKYSQDFKTLTYLTVGGLFFLYSWVHFDEFAWYQKTLSVLLLCYYGAVASIITHNVMHNKLFHNRSLNKFIQVYLSWSFGVPVSTYVPAHNLSHHHFPNRPKDASRTTLCKYDDDGWLPGNFWNMILAGYITEDGICLVVFRYLAMMGKQRRPFFFQAITEIVLYYGLLWFLLYQDWFKCLFLFHLPHEASRMFMMAWNYIQHDGTDTLPSDDAHQLHHPNTSRNFVGSWMNALFFNNGYHSVHHIHQTMHWSLLPVAHQAQYVDNPDETARIDKRLLVPCLLTYLWRHVFTKGQRVRYDGKPVDVTELTTLNKRSSRFSSWQRA